MRIFIKLEPLIREHPFNAGLDLTADLSSDIFWLKEYLSKTFIIFFASISDIKSSYSFPKYQKNFT